MTQAISLRSVLASATLASLLALPVSSLAQAKADADAANKANRWKVTCYLPNGQIIVETQASSVSRSQTGETFINQMDEAGKASLVHALYGNAICAAK